MSILAKKKQIMQTVRPGCVWSNTLNVNLSFDIAHSSKSSRTDSAKQEDHSGPVSLP